MTHELDFAKYENAEVAIFAGGCFWCMEPPYAQLEGVSEIFVGYTGGDEEAPAYKEVASGLTGHAEAVAIIFDKAKISYEELLQVFWRNINPTQQEGQFYDLGPHYRTGIFYLNDEQKRAAEKSKQDLEASDKFDRPVVTEISPAGRFWVGEDYHQAYYKKNPEHYNSYKIGSGRASYIRDTWGDES